MTAMKMNLMKSMTFHSEPGFEGAFHGQSGYFILGRTPFTRESPLMRLVYCLAVNVGGDIMELHFHLN